MLYGGTDTEVAEGHGDGRGDAECEMRDARCERGAASKKIVDREVSRYNVVWACACRLKGALALAGLVLLPNPL